jgi:hypothetical protein
MGLGRGFLDNFWVWPTVVCLDVRGSMFAGRGVLRSWRLLSEGV